MMGGCSPAEVLACLSSPALKCATVSGILTTKPSLIEWVDRNVPGIDVITTKSYQVMPDAGNREPVLVEAGIGCYGNAVGLRNPGMEKGFDELLSLRSRHSMRALLNISLSGNSVDDFALLVKKFEPVADLLELNFSCPHAGEGYGSSIGSDAALTARYVKALRALTSKPLFPKLTPNVPSIEAVAVAAMASGADGIAAINTVGPEVYYEPHTGMPILSNPRGHKGGKSGRWILDEALSKIAAIRGEIGPGAPLIGMGGITTGADVRAMREAGAQTVGLGSLFIRVPHPVRPAFVKALRDDTEQGTCLSGELLINERLMEYRPYKISRREQKGSDLLLLTLDGACDCRAGEYVFLWVPGAGEKPFSMAYGNPMTFVIRKRHYDKALEQGIVTEALFSLKVGDTVLIRGPYGKEGPPCGSSTVMVVAGGTGIAVVPALLSMLSGKASHIRIYYGVKRGEEPLFSDLIREYGHLETVADQDEPGAVLGSVSRDLESRKIRPDCCYNIGPPLLMAEASRLQETAGVRAERIWNSLETHTMCGVGICGECECGGHLTCQEGTFVSYAFLQDHGLDLS
ncbi:MAG: dihydroorotate dehydrogenase [Candidatus Eremiobacteraeota bacterium]|nr:dihydroorotate dehydrogenase [Candidatus Eremiobacteraeota bacterium]